MILYPKQHFNNVREITIEFLQKNKIKALILDVDNTLIDYDKNLPEGTIEWAEDLKQQGIKLYILSNSNKKEKVKTVAEKLKVEYEYFGKKPLKYKNKDIRKILDVILNKMYEQIAKKEVETIMEYIVKTKKDLDLLK